MKTVSIAVISMAMFGVLSLSAQADSGMHDMSGMNEQAQNTHRGQGTVNGIDAKTGKINLSHGPIESLGWPAMTMGFPAQDAAMLEGIKSGMKVDFELEKRDGKYLIVKIAPSK